MRCPGQPPAAASRRSSSPPTPEQQLRLLFLLIRSDPGDTFPTDFGSASAPSRCPLTWRRRTPRRRRARGRESPAVYWQGGLESGSVQGERDLNGERSPTTSGTADLRRAALPHDSPSSLLCCSTSRGCPKASDSARGTGCGQLPAGRPPRQQAFVLASEGHAAADAGPAGTTPPPRPQVVPRCWRLWQRDAYVVTQMNTGEASCAAVAC